jgi:hypothetical protein
MFKRRVDSLAPGRRRKVGGARLPLPLTQVDRDRNSLVAVVFDGFDLAAANRHRLTKPYRDVDLAGAGPLLAGINQDILCQLLENFETVTEA